MQEALVALLERLEDLRQYAIERLDELQGDPDLEPDLAGSNGEEWTEDAGNWLMFHFRGNDDREADDDFEPSLGSVDSLNQRVWAQGSCQDLEDEHDGREPCCEDEGAQQDAEPDLGWRNYAPDWPPTNTTLRGSPDYE